MTDNRLRIGITQGDTNGVGWELILKILSDQRILELCTPVVYGSQAAAAYYRRTLKDTEPVEFVACRTADDAQAGRANLVECGQKELRITPGQESEEGGRAAADALLRAADDLKNRRIDALVTAPIDKHAIRSEAFPYTGHTEFLAAVSGGEAMMIMCSDVLRVGLVTIHIPVSEVAAAIDKESIVRRIMQLNDSLKRDFGVVAPRIAVLSLNPHAGDGGLLGEEESSTIKPAIEQAYADGVLCFGPLAVDGLFASGAYKKYDAILAMYHDQGLAPFKALAMEDGVNYTAGAGAVQDALARRRELYRLARYGAHVARPRRGIRHRRPRHRRSAVDALGRICGDRHRCASQGLRRVEPFAARTLRAREGPRRIGQGSAPERGRAGIAAIMGKGCSDAVFRLVIVEAAKEIEILT